MDSSCSVVASKLQENGNDVTNDAIALKKMKIKMNGGEPYYVNVGNNFGFCEGFHAECNIESCINMGSVELSASPRQGPTTVSTAELVALQGASTPTITSAL